MVSSRRLTSVLCLAVICALASPAWSGDWPTWRCDSGRGGATPDALPKTLRLQWSRRLGVPRPAWPPGQRKLQFDASYEPVAAGKLLFVPSMAADNVTAYETETGRRVWRFYAGGPVRFAPAVWKGRLYFVSDDGCLYCLRADTGKLLWKRRGGPDDSRIIGNGRLISTWPARGAPAIRDGKVYWAAGIWPFMGTFITCTDAAGGRTVWCNSGSGSRYITQQHGAPSFAGVAPQGYLAVAPEALLVPGGRTVPAAYDRATGAFRYFHVASRTFGKDAGGYDVCATDAFFFNRGAGYVLADGKPLEAAAPAVVDGSVAYYLRRGKLTVRRLEFRFTEQTVRDKRGRKRTVRKRVWAEERHLPIDPAVGRLFIKAGPRLYGSGRSGAVVAVEAASPARAAWRGSLDGTPTTMLAADGKLFVVTKEGGLYCFGARAGSPPPADRAAPARRGDAAAARRVLQAAGVTEGYCVVLAPGDLAVAELARQTRLHVIVVDADAGKIASLRESLDAAGLYGTRVHAVLGGPEMLPPYLAGLVIATGVPAAGIEQVYRLLRPYGGKACLAPGAGGQAALAAAGKLPGAKLTRSGELTLLTREGPLPGSASWTHQYADAGNSVVSRDALVKVPLGLLWFGGPSNENILPRHGHGPSPQVAGGRLFIEGRHLLRCVDVYTGRVLWEKTLRDLGKYYDNTSHRPGANAIGSNYVSLPDSVYVVHDRKILRLDAASGKTLSTFTLPGGRPNVGYIGVDGDLLVATASPITVSADGKKPGGKKAGGKKAGGKKAGGKKAGGRPAPVDALSKVPGVAMDVKYSTDSTMLAVMDRKSGKVLWTRRAAYGFRHNAIAIAARKVFCIDTLTGAKLAHLARRGYAPPRGPTLYALDARSGRVVWKTERDVFGTWLGYSARHDALVQAGSNSRDRARDEAAAGVVVYRGATGQVIWKDRRLKHNGPLMLWGDLFITNGAGGGQAYELLTGRPAVRIHPLTGRKVPWTFRRHYGCNTAVASRHLLMFRSGAAGYYDLRTHGGTGNLGGFKSGCTSSLIAADGLLNAPDYTRTCICSYQNQTSLAMVHSPGVEMWTFSALGPPAGRIVRVGLNFGAPGDRKGPGGTLWLDTPSVGGPSPNPKVTVTGPADYLRRHAALMAGGDGPAWVAASGVRGARSIAVDLNGSGTYTVRLHFAELEGLPAGRRVFDVAIQARKVLRGFDIAKVAGGPGRSVVRTFAGVAVNGTLTVSLSGGTGRPLLCGLEVVKE